MRLDIEREVVLNVLMSCMAVGVVSDGGRGARRRRISLKKSPASMAETTRGFRFELGLPVLVFERCGCVFACFV